jgi:hypothetical protein
LNNLSRRRLGATSPGNADSAMCPLAARWQAGRTACRLPRQRRAAADSGVTADGIEGVVIAVAPVVGSARVVLAGGKILQPWASRSLWPTPRWPRTATPDSSSNPARPISVSAPAPERHGDRAADRRNPPRSGRRRATAAFAERSRLAADPADGSSELVHGRAGSLVRRRHQAPRWRATGSRKGLHHRLRGLQPGGEAQAPGEHATTGWLGSRRPASRIAPPGCA